MNRKDDRMDVPTATTFKKIKSLVFVVVERSILLSPLPVDIERVFEWMVFATRCK